MALWSLALRLRLWLGPDLSLISGSKKSSGPHLDGTWSSELPGRGTCFRFALEITVAICLLSAAG
jgi:hypothetical protein